MSPAVTGGGLVVIYNNTLLLLEPASATEGKTKMVLCNGAGSRPREAAAAACTPQFALQFLRGRWFMVFAAVLIMSASGATYIFSIYSTVLKSSLNYDQRTLNTLSFFKDLGTNVGILSGLINEVTPPSFILYMGACMNLFGYLMMYLAITGRTHRPPVWLMCLYICVGANSQAFANTGVLVTVVKNHPESRGIVLGLLKGFVGLSGAIFTQLYLAIYGNDAASLVLLIAWLPAAISFIFAHKIRIMPYVHRRDGEDNGPFYCILYISIALALFLLVMIIVQQQVHFSHPAYSVSVAVVVLLLFLPIFVVLRHEYNLYMEKQQEPVQGITVEQPPKPAPPVVADQSSSSPAAVQDHHQQRPCLSCVKNMFRPPARGEDYSILQTLFSIDMLILFIASVCGVGGTLTAIDNMGQIGQSLGYPPKAINTFVSLISIWNYTGRVTAGFLSEFLLVKFRMPRPLVFTVVQLVSCLGHLLIAFGVPQSLYVSSIIIGFCFGAQWPLLYAIISELFGLKYYATLYNFGAVASPIGAYILNVLITGKMYDEEAAKQTGGLGKTCLGVVCFKKPFLIVTGVTLVGAVVSFVLVLRTRTFYKGDIYARFRNATAAGNGAAASAAQGGGVEIVDTAATKESAAVNGNGHTR